MRSDRSRWLGFGLCASLLMAGAMQAWPGQVDDVYISLVYSHELAENGRLAWSDGRVTEGFSSPLWVALGTMAALSPLDPSVVLQAASLVAALLLTWQLAPGSTPSLRSARWWIPLAVALSDPMTWWAGNGMETLAYSLMLTSGWCALLAGSSLRWPLLLLGASALVRPEGVTHLVAGTLFAIAGSSPARAVPWASMAAAWAMLGVVQVCRVLYFGEWMPLPVMVKALDGAGVLRGALQLSFDLGPWLPALVLSWAMACKHGVRTRLLALTPLALQALVLAKAGGDWMAHGRMLLPGLLATLAVQTRLADQRPAPGHRWHWGVACLLATMVVSPTGQPTTLIPRNPLDPVLSVGTSRLDVDTTLMSDLQFVASRIPAGELIYSSDIGMLGHVSGLVVRDMVGLTDVDVARSRGLGDRSALQRTLERMSGEDGSALCLRMVGWGDQVAPKLPLEQSTAYPHTYLLRDEWAVIEYHCRRPLAWDPTLAEQRWAALAQRLPAHTWIRWNHALALADLGRLVEALAKVESVDRPWRWRPWNKHNLSGLSFVRSSGTLVLREGARFELKSGETLTSRSLGAEELSGWALSVEPVVDGPQVAVQARLVGDACVGEPVPLLLGGASRPLRDLMGCDDGAGDLRVEVSGSSQLPPGTTLAVVYLGPDARSSQR